MKIRNGFVSNSSSSSFIITLPKDKNIRLSEMEDYLGGYSDKLTDEQKDNLSIFLWKTIKTKEHSIEEPIEHHEECLASYKELHKLFNDCKCLGQNYWSTDGESAPDRCKDCKYYHRYDRPARSDDYYDIRDNEWIEDKSILDVDKSNYYITIDDSEPGDYLDYGDAIKFRNISPLFKSRVNVVEVD